MLLLGPCAHSGSGLSDSCPADGFWGWSSAPATILSDNGIKFFNAQGSKLPDEWELAVEEALKESPVWVDSASLGKSRRLDDAAGRYIEFCKSTFPHDLTLKGLKIVVDGANGRAPTRLPPTVFHELGADVIAIGCTPDGLNINKDVGATHPQALLAAVKAHGADLGVRWMAMLTVSNLLTARAAFSMATSCCTSLPMSAYVVWNQKGMARSPEFSDRGHLDDQHGR